MKKIITLLLFTVFLMGCDGATETAVPTAEPSNQTNAEIVLDALAQVVECPKCVVDSRLLSRRLHRTCPRWTGDD